MPFRVVRFWSSLNAMAASAGRFSAPSGRRISSPNASTRLFSPGVPGSTTSRAMTSPSTTTPPSSLNVADTVDLPAPIPPVNPIRSTPNSVSGKFSRPDCRIGSAPFVGQVESGRQGFTPDPEDNTMYYFAVLQTPERELSPEDLQTEMQAYTDFHARAAAAIRSR